MDRKKRKIREMPDAILEQQVDKAIADYDENYKAMVILGVLMLFIGGIIGFTAVDSPSRVPLLAPFVLLVAAFFRARAKRELLAPFAEYIGRLRAKKVSSLTSESPSGDQEHQ